MEKCRKSKDPLIQCTPEKHTINKKVDFSRQIRCYKYLLIFTLLVLVVLLSLVIKNTIQINELHKHMDIRDNVKVVNVEQQGVSVLKIDKDLQQEKIELYVTPKSGRLSRRSPSNSRVRDRGIDDEQSLEISLDSSETPQSNDTTIQPTVEQGENKKNKGKNRKNKDGKKSKKRRNKKVAVHLVSNIPVGTWSLAMKMGQTERHHFHHGFIEDQAYSPYDVTYAFWKLDDWCKDNRLVKLSRNTTLTVKESGTYYIYVQIMYRDDKRMWAVAVFIDDQRFVQCVGSKSLPADSGATSHQCNVGATTYIEKGQKLHVGSLYRSTKLILVPSATFWGLIKLD